MQQEKPKYTYIDHTADVGFKVFGRDLKTLFENAAEGFFEIITDLNRVENIDEREVHVEATDQVALMVEWLSELNYLFLTERHVFSSFEVLQVSETELRAKIKGEPLDLDRHEIYTEIKAVTYHGLYVRHGDSGWEAQVIFDL